MLYKSCLYVFVDFRLICVCVLIGLESIKVYIDFFKYGVSFYVGGGIGKLI